MKKFDLEELAKFDGKEGRPLYVAHQGNVYDVSDSKLWKNGLHMNRHHGGRDLTTDIKGAPWHGDAGTFYPGGRPDPGNRSGKRDS